MQYIALQQSEVSRVKYMAEVSVTMLIWIGSDRRNEIRKYGYSLKGMPAHSYQLRVGGKQLSAIPVMTTNGIEDVYVTSGSVNGDVFQHFFSKCVCHLMVRIPVQ